jgi:hypothetical protein
LPCRAFRRHLDLHAIIRTRHRWRMAGSDRCR